MGCPAPGPRCVSRSVDSVVVEGTPVVTDSRNVLPMHTVGNEEQALWLVIPYTSFHIQVRARVHKSRKSFHDA